MTTPQTPLTRAGDCSGAEATDPAELVDRVAAAVRAVPGVHDLHGGAFGEVAAYLPGRRVPGLRVGSDVETWEIHLSVRWALGQAFGQEAVNTGIGGSIPFISTFAQVYPEAEILVTGVEDPYSKAHSEDESVDIESLRKVIGAEALFLARLGGLV